MLNPIQNEKKNLATFAPIELLCFVSGKNLSILDYANRYWTETRSNVKIFTYTMIIHDFRDSLTGTKNLFTHAHLSSNGFLNS